MPIIAVHHVQLAMPPNREDEARAFYVRVLGFEEVAKPANLAKRGGVWFHTNGVDLHLGVEADFRPAKKAHPAFLVDGLKDIEERCAVFGYTVSRDEPLQGYDRIYLSDPFGNRIELLQKCLEK